MDSRIIAARSAAPSGSSLGQERRSRFRAGAEGRPGAAHLIHRRLPGRRPAQGRRRLARASRYPGRAHRAAQMPEPFWDHWAAAKGRIRQAPAGLRRNSTISHQYCRSRCGCSGRDGGTRPQPKENIHDRASHDTILVDATPQQAFDAINRPRAWWGKEIEGDTDRLGAEWTYRYKDMHFSTHCTTEFVWGKRVVWDVLQLEMSFLKDKSEWKGTRLVFDISLKGDKTEVRFTHVGLVPQVECFDVCTDAGSGLIQESLKRLIDSGEGLARHRRTVSRLISKHHCGWHLSPAATITKEPVHDQTHTCRLHLRRSTLRICR